MEQSQWMTQLSESEAWKPVYDVSGKIIAYIAKDRLIYQNKVLKVELRSSNFPAVEYE